MVGTEGTHEVEVSGACHCGHVGAEGLGELDGEAADTAGGADDQDSLTRSSATDVAQRLERGDAGHSCDCRLLEAQIGRLGHQLVLVGGRVLGQRAVGDAEHLVARGEPGDVGSDGHDAAGNVETGDPVLRFGEPVTGEADQVRGAGHEVAGATVDSCGHDFDEHLVGLRCRVGPRCELEDVGRAVSVLGDGAHLLGGKRFGVADGGRLFLGGHVVPLVVGSVVVSMCGDRRGDRDDLEVDRGEVGHDSVEMGGVTDVADETGHAVGPTRR